jgi:uncharacterized membrane protein
MSSPVITIFYFSFFFSITSGFATSAIDEGFDIIGGTSAWTTNSFVEGCFVNTISATIGTSIFISSFLISIYGDITELSTDLRALSKV